MLSTRDICATDAASDFSFRAFFSSGSEAKALAVSWALEAAAGDEAWSGAAAGDDAAGDEALPEPTAGDDAFDDVEATTAADDSTGGDEAATVVFWVAGESAMGIFAMCGSLAHAEEDKV